MSIGRIIGCTLLGVGVGGAIAYALSGERSGAVAVGETRETPMDFPNSGYVFLERSTGRTLTSGMLEIVHGEETVPFFDANGVRSEMSLNDYQSKVRSGELKRIR